MHAIFKISSFVLILIFPVAATAQSVQDDFDRIQQTENAAWTDFDNMVLQTETMGMTTFEYLEKTSSLTLDNGDTVYITRSVPVDELQERHFGGNEFSNASPEQLREAATKIQEQMNRAQGEFDREMANSGAGGTVIGGMISNPPQDEPWLATNPKSMGNLYAMFLRGAADAKEARAAEDPAGDARRRAEDMQQLVSFTRRVATDPIDGRATFGLFAENLEAAQTSASEDFIPRQMTMVVDAERYVPLRMKIEGRMIADGQSREVSIERDDMDYRNVPGCGDLYRPHRSIMRLGGVMTPEEQAQMAEAQVQMAEFEKEMAQMPESQRAMIMRQMGPQMEMMKKMVSGGGIEIESKIVDIKCDVDTETALNMAMSTVGGGMLGGTGVMMPGSNTQPYYVDEKGIGVIRHEGEASEYFLNVKAAGDVLAGPMGPYKGPNVGIFIGSLSMMGLPFDQIELELYQENPQRTSVLFKPEVNADRAESKADCGDVSAIGECSN